jgi:hypothetical protein
MLTVFKSTLAVVVLVTAVVAHVPASATTRYVPFAVNNGVLTASAMSTFVTAASERPPRVYTSSKSVLLFKYC